MVFVWICLFILKIKFRICCTRWHKRVLPTVPNNDPLVLFDKDGNPITNGDGKDLDNTQLPTKSPLFSPRVGFNWDVKGDKTLQVRGGSGLFTGRFPFVWIGNHIGNPFSFFYNATDKDFQWPQVWRTNIGTDFKIPYWNNFHC